MSELKVIVDGKEREIRGVSEETTCEDIILVLAKAAGKTGKVALLERWRGFERILPPDDCPTKAMQSWGSFKHDVTLVLQDESLSTYNHLNKTSINSRVDDNSELIKRSPDCESLEDSVTIQQHKIELLSRAVEIIELHLSCWNSNEEAFLYSTEEEIAEELAVDLEKVLKLQADELVELKTWENEVKNLEQTNANLAKQRESFGDKISKLEERIAEAYDAVDMLLEDLEKEENSSYIEMRTSETDSARLRKELEVISRELSEKNALFSKQDLELNSISSSMSELDLSIQSKNDSIVLLKEEIESCSYDFNMTENFLPKLPEVEPAKRHGSGNVDDRDVETVETLDSMKINHENNEFQYSPTKVENATKIAHKKEEMFKSKNPSNSVEAFFEIENHKTATSEELHKLSSLSTTFLENGNDETDGFSIANFKEIPDRTKMQNVEMSSKSSPSFSKDFRPISPEVETKTPETPNHFSPNSASNSTNNLTTKSSDMSKFRSKRKESFKKIRDVFEKRNGNESVVNNETISDQKLTRNAGKPPTAPKPPRNKLLPPHLENAVLPLEEKFSSGSRGFSESKQTFIARPKPYINSGAVTETPDAYSNTKATKMSQENVNQYFWLTSSPESSDLEMSQSSSVNSSDFNAPETKNAMNYAQEVQSKNSKLSTAQENSYSKLPERYNSVDYLEAAKERKVLKLTAKPYGMNIVNTSVPKTWDKSKNLSKHQINSADFQLPQTRDHSKHVVTTSNTKGGTRTQDSTKGRTNSYVTHSSKPTTTSVLSQPSLSSGQSSRSYFSPPTVLNNGRHSKKENVVSNIDSSEQGVFV